MKTLESKESLRAEFYQRFSDQGVMKSRLKKTVRGNYSRFLKTFAEIGKRLFDFFLAAFLIFLATPLFLIASAALPRGEKRLLRSLRVGRYAEFFPLFSFNFRENALGRILKKFHFDKLPVLFNILSGDMSFVGPRAVAPEQLNLREKMARRRTDARPGLLCLWWIRRRANIDYGSEFESDAEYINNYGVLNDLGIAARAVPTIFYGGTDNAPAPDKINLLGIPVCNTTMTEAVEIIAAQLDAVDAKQFCFVNADCANIAAKNDSYKQVLNSAGYVFADGIGMKLAGKMLRTGIKQNVNGTDLFPRLCENLADSEKRLFLLGAKPEIADAVRDWAVENYPGIIICGTRHGYFSAAEEPEVINQINESRADLLLVAFGAPRQDIWIAGNLSKLNIKAAIGVGGLFDYYSGRIPRAPQWLREMGFEWFFRFYQEPRRMWRRYFVGNFEFLIRIGIEKLFKKQT